MARPRGFEPLTCPLGGGRAIQLCHGRRREILPHFVWNLKWGLQIIDQECPRG